MNEGQPDGLPSEVIVILAGATVVMVKILNGCTCDMLPWTVLILMAPANGIV